MGMLDQPLRKESHNALHISQSKAVKLNSGAGIRGERFNPQICTKKRAIPGAR